MTSTESLIVTLPDDMARQVRAKVASGEYASEGEVVADGLRVLLAGDAVLDRWLHNEAKTSYAALKSDPGLGRSLDEVSAELAARHRRATTLRTP